MADLVYRRLGREGLKAVRHETSGNLILTGQLGGAASKTILFLTTMTSSPPNRWRNARARLLSLGWWTTTSSPGGRQTTRGTLSTASRPSRLFCQFGGSFSAQSSISFRARKKSGALPLNCSLPGTRNSLHRTNTCGRTTPSERISPHFHWGTKGSAIASFGAAQPIGIFIPATPRYI